MQSAQAQESSAKAVLAPKIVFAITDKTFPAEWLKAPTLVHAEPIPASDENRSTRAIRTALAIYPPRFLADNLSTIYVVSHLSEGQTTVGGFGNSETKAIYINNDGQSAAYTDFVIERGVHHELAHLLYANHPRNISFLQWQGLNTAGFHYGAGSLEWLKDNVKHPSDDLLTNEKFLAQGFVRDYALCDVEEDFASTVEALLSGSPELWQAFDRYEIIKKKVGMAIAFYQSLDKTMTESFFRHIPPTIAYLPTDYNAGDVVLFPDGGSVTIPGKNGAASLKFDVPVGGSAVLGEDTIVVFNPHKP